MKMLALLAGELSNSAKFFTTFADVNSANHRDLQKSFSIDGSKGVETVQLREVVRNIVRKWKC